MKQWALFFAASALWAATAAAPCGAAGLGGLAGKARPKSESKKGEKQEAVEVSASLPPYTGPKKRLGVMDLEVKVTASSTTEPTPSGGTMSTTTVYLPPPTDFGTGLTEMLTTELVKTNRFIVLERKSLADIQAEQALGTGGGVDPASAAKGGKMLGAQVFVRGAVTEYSYRKSSFGGRGILGRFADVSRSKAEAMVALDIRLYDNTTGQIIDSVRAEGRAKAIGTSAEIGKGDIRVSGAGFAMSPLGQATRQAIERAVLFVCEKMKAVPWEGCVAEIEATGKEGAVTLYINAGSDMGIKVGDRLEILRPGREIVDPQTRLVLGRTKDDPLGLCQIEAVMKELATAVPVKGRGFQVGDVVRLIDTRER